MIKFENVRCSWKCIILCFVLATEVVVGVPAVYLEYTKNLLPPNVAVSAQNCYKVPKGAFTGMYSCSRFVVYTPVKVK